MVLFNPDSWVSIYKNNNIIPYNTPFVKMYSEFFNSKF